MFFRKICLIAIPSGFFNVWLRQNGVQQFVTITRRPFNASVGQGYPQRNMTSEMTVRYETCTVCFFIFMNLQLYYLFMQLPCVLMRDNTFLAGIFTFLVCLTKKVKITTKNISSPIITLTQGGWIYKFIQFSLIEKWANVFYENPRNMKEARYVTYLTRNK